MTDLDRKPIPSEPAPAWGDATQWAGLRDGSRCPICVAGVPGDLVLDLPFVWVTAPRRSAVPWALTLFAKRHVVEPFELSPEETSAFWAAVNRVAAELNAALSPTKINYEIHGNTIPHLHVNMFPRWRGDAFEGRPIDPRTTIDRLEAEIDSLRAILGRLAEV